MVLGEGLEGRVPGGSVVSVVSAYDDDVTCQFVLPVGMELTSVRKPLETRLCFQ